VQGLSPPQLAQRTYRDSLMVLNKDRNAACARCHAAGDYSNCNCYDWREHIPANVRDKHTEQGIQDFANCVECHRSAGEEPGGKGSGEGGGDRKRCERD